MGRIIKRYHKRGVFINVNLSSAVSMNPATRHGCHVQKYPIDSILMFIIIYESYNKDNIDLNTQTRYHIQGLYSHMCVISDP